MFHRKNKIPFCYTFISIFLLYIMYIFTLRPSHCEMEIDERRKWWWRIWKVIEIFLKNTREVFSWHKHKYRRNRHMKICRKNQERESDDLTSPNVNVLAFLFIWCLLFKAIFDLWHFWLMLWGNVTQDFNEK